MCRVLCLSESGYYRWLRNREKRNRRQLLAVKIDAILAEHPDNRNYGVDRVCLALEQDGILGGKCLRRIDRKLCPGLECHFCCHSVNSFRGLNIG